MGIGRQAGYTIVEVTLFLAITGLLIMTVLIGFSGAISNNRKTDTTRSFESAIVNIYSDARSGEATRPVDTAGKSTCIIQQAFPGASNECLVIGKLLRFVDTSTVNVYNVVSRVNPESGCTATGVEGLECYDPRVLDMADAVDHITPQWQATIGQVAFQNKTTGIYRTDNNLLAFLRHPASELVYVLPMRDIAVNNAGPYDIPTAAFDSNYANAKGHVCLKHDNFPVPITYVRFNGGEGIGSIDMSDTRLAGAPACS